MEEIDYLGAVDASAQLAATPEMEESSNETLNTADEEGNANNIMSFCCKPTQ